MSTSQDRLFHIARAVPKKLPISAPFWEGTRQKKLVIQYCRDTGQYQFFPRAVSVFTGSDNLEWREVSGLGEVFTFTIARVGRGGFADAVPFIVASVLLEEGVTILSNIVDCDIDQVEIGMKVKPAWAPLEDGTNLLLFTPA